MDPSKNPYAPGAGTPPPELAGRDAVLDDAAVALDRIRRGLSAKCIAMIGLRGVGKTVLLGRIARDAGARGISAVQVEAKEGGALAPLLALPLRSCLLSMSRRAAASDKAKRALRALGSFVRSASIRHGDLEFGFDAGREPGVADSGDLEHDLGDLLRTAGEAAQARDAAVVLFVDELQYLAEPELAALIAALHQAAQRQLPVSMVGAGLPQTVANAGKARTYAERLFSFREIGALDAEAAARALERPAEALGVSYAPDAVDLVIRRTSGYPYFLQEWGKQCWDCAESSPVTLADADEATARAETELDASFFRVRFDRLTPSEKRYLRAMAELESDPRRSGDVAGVLGKPVTSVAPVRSKLIHKGMIYSPAHGDTAFTVPLFDEYLRRAMPAPAAAPRQQ